MKHIKLINSVVQSVFMIALVSITLFSLFGISMYISVPLLTAASGISIFGIRATLPGVATATIYREMWTGELRRNITAAEKDTFLDGIADYSRYVSAVGDEAQAIHLAYMGVAPDVLINNTTYPIAVQDLPIDDIVIQLDKYQTKATPITDDELYASSVNKTEGVRALHQQAIVINKLKKSLHALAPSGNTADMPVLVTTGGDDGTGRKKLIWEDVLRLKRELDKLEVPEESRRLVLCSDHVNDLCTIDQSFKDKYYNRESGKIYNQLGFDIREHLSAPYFNASTKAKLSFGAAPTTGTHFKASVFFRTDLAAKATGWTKMYASVAEQDPTMQRSLVNFRHYFIVLPLLEKGRGGIVSAAV